MKCSLSVVVRSIALLAFSAFSVHNASAITITLNLEKPLSSMTLTGFFAGNPFLAQDGQAGTTDYDPASPSLKTTYQGTITVDVDNLLAPTSIKLINSTANADPSGKWLPEAEPYLDIDGGGLLAISPVMQLHPSALRRGAGGRHRCRPRLPNKSWGTSRVGSVPRRGV